MEKVIQYKTIDGKIFRDPDEATRHERLFKRIQLAMEPLGQIPEGVRDGKGWLQHDLEVVNAAKDMVIQICVDEGYANHYPVFNNKGRDIHPCSIVGRILDDCDGPLSDAWSRFRKIDIDGREHQQPFFAYGGGPDKDHVCIEDRTKK
jgi:hypothetical protein